jgi:hypothetical protein
VVVDQVEAGLVEDRGSVGLSHGETDGIGETLTERASGDFDTGGVMSLGVTGGDAVDLLQTLSVINRTGDDVHVLVKLTRKFFKSSMVTL